MKVSVIIPFYSNIKWLEEAVESVLNQTFTDYEIIVVNDGSPENDIDFLMKYKKYLNYLKTGNKGPAHARNYGISIAKGEYLAFLDSDDLWREDKLEKQIAYMEANNSVWCHTNYSTFSNESKEILKYNKLHNYSGLIYPKSLAATHIATPSVIIRRDVMINNTLRFEEKMRFGQDYFLWLQLSKKFKLDLVEEDLLKVRVRGSNAAIRARAHIQVRGQIWDLLKDNDIFLNIKFGEIIRFNYRVCSLLNKFLFSLEKRFNKNYIENISKILYIIPYTIFKLIFKIS